MIEGPGPEERRPRNRLIYKITGRWPQRVVDERLACSAVLTIERRREMDAWMKELWTSRPSELWPEERWR